ncbi:MAG TPA: sigma-70 family RNA polymerase sigma factor [Steroidobacteraceae bacterium]|nr:sigma-70 family RNA polymerase sigma factor [Steroidobacteraceae bacterium]
MKQPEKWLNDLVAETRGGLARYLARLCASPDDVQDVMQEAYLQVFCALRKSGPEGHAPAALLYTTARNIAFSRLRHQKVVAAAAPAFSIDERLRREQPGVERQASRNEQLQLMLRVVNGLPPKCRDVFVLRMIDGLSQREIAERLGIAVSTVEKHLARGLQQCRQEFTGALSAAPPEEAADSAAAQPMGRTGS